MIPGNAALAGLVAGGVVNVVVTCAQALFTISDEFLGSFDFEKNGFETADCPGLYSSVFGSHADTFGSRSPTSAFSITVECAYTVKEAGSPGRFALGLNGDLSAGAPFSRVELINAGVVEEVLFPDTNLESLEYDAGTSSTTWLWHSLTHAWPSSGSRTVAIYR